jgi:hypothetical protein
MECTTWLFNKIILCDNSQFLICQEKPFAKMRINIRKFQCNCVVEYEIEKDKRITIGCQKII